MKIKNRLEIDFDAMPDEVMSKLAHKVEKFISDNCPEVALHGSCSLLDEDSLVHETAYRVQERMERVVGVDDAANFLNTIPTPIADAIMNGHIIFLDTMEN